MDGVDLTVLLLLHDTTNYITDRHLSRVSHREQAAPLLKSLSQTEQSPTTPLSPVTFQVEGHHCLRRGTYHEFQLRVLYLLCSIDLSTFHELMLHTAPEDIVLGPPKTSFASASSSRTTIQPPDSTDRHTVDNTGNETSRDGRFNFRDRFFKERDKGDREGDRQREHRSGTLPSRRGGREGAEHWTGVKPREAAGQEEVDHRTRRNGENGLMERDLERDSSHRPPKESNVAQWDTERVAEGVDQNQRRHAPGRSRNEPSWFKDDDTSNDKDSRTGRNNTRGRDWREKDRDRGSYHAADRDWARGGKVEQDPEWMGSPESEEKKQSHTQEDFERWKERMKASSTPAEGKASSRPEQPIGRHSSTSELSKPEPVSKNDTPLVMDRSLDKFFGLWNDPKPRNEAAQEENTGDTVRKEPLKTNTSKPSRFVGFFNPQPESSGTQFEASAPSSNPAAVAQDSSNEDKEGFQRILQMLGGANPGPSKSTPQMNSSQHPKQLNLKDHPSRPYAPDRPPSSGWANEPQTTTHIDASMSSVKPMGLESLLGPQSPREGPPQNRDSEFLLKLMQQSRTTTAPGQTHQYSQRTLPGNAPGILPFPEIMNRQPDVPPRRRPSGPQPGLYDDSLLSDMQRGEQASTRELPRRKGTGGNPPVFFDNVSQATYLRRQPQNNAQKGATPAFGLTRPPGLDQMPTPWPTQSSAPQQQSHIAPPPGFQNTSRAPNIFPPGLIPNVINTPIVNDRMQYPRVSGTGPIAQGMPPPGLMAINGPPPGFPPLPFNSEGMMGMPALNPYSGLQRQHFELYGDGANLGPDGRGVPQGHFKR